MNRIERPTDIILLLRDQPCTSTGIARRSEVSRRTVLRDVQALCEMGVPVIAQDGLHGGYSLPDDCTFDPPAPTGEGTFLLLLALRSLSRLADAPFGAARAALAAQMRAALSKSQVRSVDDWLAAVDLAVPTREARSPHLHALIRAAQTGQWLPGER